MMSAQPCAGTLSPPGTNLSFDLSRGTWTIRLGSLMKQTIHHSVVDNPAPDLFHWIVVPNKYRSILVQAGYKHAVRVLVLVPDFAPGCTHIYPSASAQFVSRHRSYTNTGAFSCWDRGSRNDNATSEVPGRQEAQPHDALALFLSP